MPLESARFWMPGEFLVQVKADGVFQTREINAGGSKFLLAGEFVTKKSGGFLTTRDRKMLDKFPGGFFVAFDFLADDGLDASSFGLRRRWLMLLGKGKFFPPDCILVESFNGEPWEIPSDAEGLVAKRWHDPYGEMLCVKQCKTYCCTVTQIDGRQSVGIAEIAGGVMVDRGRVSLHGGKCDKVRIGSILNVTAMDETDSGKLREPKCAGENWLVKF